LFILQIPFLTISDMKGQKYKTKFAVENT